MKIGKKLKDLRLGEHKTQGEIALLLGVDRSNYSKYELDKLEVNLDMLAKLAICYDVSADFLIGLKEI